MEQNPYERRSTEDIRDRLARAEANIDNLKSNFQVMATEFRNDVNELKKSVETIRAQLIKVIIVVTVLSQAAGDIAPTLLKSLVG